ncbi:Factor of dna methylation [Thalictrum thalictroides]|uniref:Factor of dna methylation n=1 Tax=Thalictrum thalictroides TaxID=46969 RepID=A0A7J6VH69_THATH|nr:Factor of dna methylation [Thalictrum thalictroides]
MVEWLTTRSALEFKWKDKNTFPYLFIARSQWLPSVATSEGTSGKPQVTNGERTAQTRIDLTEELEITEALHNVVRVKLPEDSGWKSFSNKMFAIGIKRMGDLDLKPFTAACYRKYQSTHVADVRKSIAICSLWQSKLADPSWHPFQVVKKNGIAQKILLEADEQLKELKHDLGSEVYDPVCRALMEINEYNASGSYPVEEL